MGDLANIVQSLEPVTLKQFYDFDYKDSCRAATTANGTLASAFANGQTIDGVTLATGNRILIKNQTDSKKNGIYTVNATGAPTRAIDANSSSKVTSGLFTSVSEGTANADKSFVLTTNDAIVLDTAPLAFAEITASISGLDATKIADGSVTSAEFQHISTLSSNAQTQINSKVNQQAFDTLEDEVADLDDAKAPKANPTFTGTVVLPNGTVSADMLNDNIISGQAALSTLAATDKLLIDNESVVKYITYAKLENIVHDNNYLTNVTTEYANQTALVLTTSMKAVPGDGSLKTTFTTPPGVTSVTVEAGAFIYNSGGYGLYTLGLGGHSSASTYSEFYAAHGISGQVTTSKWVSYGYYQRTLAMCAWHLKGLTQSTTYHINLFSLKSGGNAYIYVGGGYPMAYLRVRNSHQYISSGL